MECKGYDCRFYEGTNPFGNRPHCRIAELIKGDGLVFCDEVEECLFKPRNDTDSRLRRLEAKVFGKDYADSML